MEKLPYERKCKKIIRNAYKIMEAVSTLAQSLEFDIKFLLGVGFDQLTPKFWPYKL